MSPAAGRPPGGGKEDGAVYRTPVSALDRRYAALRLGPEPGRRAALRTFLETHGGHEVLLATDSVEEGKLVLLDGFKRLSLFEERGLDEVWVAVVHLGAPEALAAMVTANGARRGLTELEEGFVVSHLVKEHGLDQSRIADLLGRHKSWVCRRLSLVDRLEKAVQEDVRVGLVKASTAREVARFPRGNQAEAVRAICRHGLTVHQAARLVSLLRAAAPEERRAILSDPLASLPKGGTHSAPSPDLRLSRAAREIREQLLRIHTAASRLGEVLLSLVPGSFVERERSLLVKLAGPALSKTLSAAEQVRAALGATEEVSLAS